VTTIKQEAQVLAVGDGKRYALDRSTWRQLMEAATSGLPDMLRRSERGRAVVEKADRTALLE